MPESKIPPLLGQALNSCRLSLGSLSFTRVRQLWSLALFALVEIWFVNFKSFKDLWKFSL